MDSDSSDMCTCTPLHPSPQQSTGSTSSSTASRKFCGHRDLTKINDDCIPYKMYNFYNNQAPQHDTIHYLSPATLSARTEVEGDFIYETPSFMRLFHEFAKAPEYSSVSSSSISCIESDLQRTIAIVKPEAMQYQDVILRAIDKAGFSFIRTRTVHLTPEQVSEIYAKHYGKSFYPHMVVSVSIGPILVVSLAGICAVSKWRDLIGPEKKLHAEWFYPMSMRVRFGLHPSIPHVLHASETVEEGKKENRYFDHESILEPILMEQEKVTDYCTMFINPTLIQGLAEVVRVKPIDPIMYLAEWLLLHNPFQPTFAPEIAILPT